MAVDSVSEASSDDSVDLKAVMKLLKKQDKRSRRLSQRVSALHSSVPDQVKVAVAEAVDPLKDELSNVKVKVELAEANVSDMNLRISEQSTSIEQIRDELQEMKMSGGSSRDPRYTKAGHRRDVAHKRVAFIGFPASSKEVTRIEKMEEFMAKHFKDIRVRFTDDSVTEGPAGKSSVTTNGFVEVGSSHMVTKIITKVKEDKLKLEGFPDVVIKRGISELDRRRNWALKKAAELIRADPAASKGKIETKDKDRAVSVNGTVAYSQKQRYDPDGQFEGKFQHLKLP